MLSPLLTVYITFLTNFIEGYSSSDEVDASILYARATIATSILFYFLIMFNEACWLINVLVFAICLAYSLMKANDVLSGPDLDEESPTVHWIVTIWLFQVFAYASIGYSVEKLRKQNFMGKESYDRSFHRWLQVFDTFPEGIAIVKDDGSIMYSNDSLAKLLECDALPKMSSSHYAT